MRICDAKVFKVEKTVRVVLTNELDEPEWVSVSTSHMSRVGSM